VDLSRDLGQIAELIELVFGPQMDPEARAAMREMQFLAHSGPWLWLLARANQVGGGFAPGFVWVENGRIVGNVSLRRGGAGGEGWLVGNVAVHPDWRRRGIGWALMQAAIGLMEEHKGRWAGLLVEHDNGPALSLYEKMGFRRLGAVTTWRYGPHPLSPSPKALGEGGWRGEGQVPFRKRRADEWEAEYQLAQVARPAGLSWIEPLSRASFRPGLLPALDRLLKGRHEEHWVVAHGNRLAAALHIIISWLGEAHELALFVRPEERGRFEAALLTHGLARLGRSGQGTVQIDHPAGEAEAESALRGLGFQPVRMLVHMKLDL